jgi:hypothetical protein
MKKKKKRQELDHCLSPKNYGYERDLSPSTNQNTPLTSNYHFLRIISITSFGNCLSTTSSYWFDIYDHHPSGNKRTSVILKCKIRRSTKKYKKYTSSLVLPYHHRANKRVNESVTHFFFVLLLFSPDKAFFYVVFFPCGVSLNITHL